jgi:RNA polymerase sigma factor (sigma-70 family)
MIDDREQLARAKAGDRAAQAELMTLHSGMLWKLANFRSLGTGESAEDFYQLACLEFLKAIDGYDFAMGTKFCTYFTSKVGRRLLTARKDCGVIRVPPNVKRDSEAYIRSQCSQLLDSTELVQPSADELVVEREEYAEKQLKLAELMKAVGKLKPREASVILLRMEGETLVRIGKKFHVTKERIRQIQMKAMVKLKEMLT